MWSLRPWPRWLPAWDLYTSVVKNLGGKKPLGTHEALQVGQRHTERVLVQRIATFHPTSQEHDGHSLLCQRK